MLIVCTFSVPVYVLFIFASVISGTASVCDIGMPSPPDSAQFQMEHLHENLVRLHCDLHDLRKKNA